MHRLSRLSSSYESDAMVKSRSVSFNWMQFMGCFAGILFSIVCCAIPLILNQTFGSDNAAIFSAMNSTSYKYSLVACVAVSFPYLLEYCLDLCLQRTLRNFVNGLCGRGLFILALFIPSIILLTVIIPLHIPVVLIFVCFFQFIVIIIGFFCLLYQLGNPVYNNHIMILSSSSFILGVIFRYFNLFYPSFYAFQILHFIFCVLGIILFIILTMKWILFIKNISHNNNNNNAITIQQYSSCLCIFAISLLYIGFMIINVKDQNILTTFESSYRLTNITYTEGLLALIIFMSPNHILRYEVIQTLVRN